MPWGSPLRSHGHPHSPMPHLATSGATSLSCRGQQHLLSTLLTLHHSSVKRTLASVFEKDGASNTGQYKPQGTKEPRRIQISTRVDQVPVP